MTAERGLRSGSDNHRTRLGHRQSSLLSANSRLRRDRRDAETVKSKMSRQSTLSEAFSIISGISIQIARKYLFVRPEFKAVLYFTIVTVVSVFAAYFPFPDHYYFVQKGNFLNEYGVKLGWFWTCFVICPLIWCTSRMHGKDQRGSLLNLARIAVATAFWYLCTTAFVSFERMTGRCLGAKSSSRSTCRADGGKWAPGIDISGHCFIIIYSILILCEESSGFRKLPGPARKSSGHQQLSEGRHHGEYLIVTRVFFFLTFILHIVWDFELLVSVIYYHHVLHKIIGALVAIFCWFVTYRAWYPFVRIPPMPFNSTFKMQQK